MKSKGAVILQAAILAAVVVVGSLLSVRIWGSEVKDAAGAVRLSIDDAMTIARFGEVNALPRPLLKKLFNLQQPTDLQKTIGETGFTRKQLTEKIGGMKALGAEKASKNWKKILVKFALWLLMLLLCGFLMGKGMVSGRVRMVLYAVAVLLFGVILGADPAPMGTVKDAVVLFGKDHVIFPPRMIALGVFLLMTIIANKFICSWGCQAGTLQDLLFRINQTSGGKPVFAQFRIPFVVSNTVRILFFLALVVGAVVWSFDIVEPVDPFRVFKPQSLGVVTVVAVSMFLAASLFVYRPWCHLFCPFGLVGWIAEKRSIVKVVVDYDKCVACGACEKACPSSVMGAILKRDRVIPDCFSCGSCIGVCPQKAVAFSSRKRVKPPAGKFS